MKNKKKTILIFIGPPGSGKGTQSDFLAWKLKLPAVSPGELLRVEVKNKTSLGRKIAKIMAGGGMVANKLTEEVLEKRLNKKDTKNGVIFDGFPRNFQQFEYLEEKLANFNKKIYNIWAIYIHISDAEAKKRLSLRRVCLCGESYHLAYNPPRKTGICNLCGLKLVHRPDDKPTVVVKRLKLFHKENDKIIKYFMKRKMLLKINGEQSIKIKSYSLISECLRVSFSLNSRRTGADRLWDEDALPWCPSCTTSTGSIRSRSASSPKVSRSPLARKRPRP